MQCEEFRMVIGSGHRVMGFFTLINKRFFHLNKKKKKLELKIPEKRLVVLLYKGKKRKYYFSLSKTQYLYIFRFQTLPESLNISREA